jgi:hypothetical protein
MLFDRSDKGAKSLDERWVRKARIAKRTTDGLEDWSQREIERWDLDDPERTPTGAKNPRTWDYEKPLRRVNRNSGDDRLVDPRKSPTIRDVDGDEED